MPTGLFSASGDQSLLWYSCLSRNNSGVVYHLGISTWDQQKKLQTDGPGATPKGQHTLQHDEGNYYLPEYNLELCFQ